VEYKTVHVLCWVMFCADYNDVELVEMPLKWTYELKHVTPHNVYSIFITEG
jgi:hypothetical protein